MIFADPIGKATIGTKGLLIAAGGEGMGLRFLWKQEMVTAGLRELKAPSKPPKLSVFFVCMTLHRNGAELRSAKNVGRHFIRYLS